MIRVEHVANPSFDPAATHRFYHDLLEAPLTLALTGTGDDGVAWLVVEYAFGGVSLAFLTYAGMTRVDDGLPDDIRHVAFTVHDAAEADRWAQRFEAAGVRWKSELHDDDPHVYVYDPNGVVLEFAAPYLAGAGSAEHAAATLAAWIAEAPAEVTLQDQREPRAMVEMVTPITGSAEYTLPEYQAMMRIAQRSLGPFTQTHLYLYAATIGLLGLMIALNNRDWSAYLFLIVGAIFYLAAYGFGARAAKKFAAHFTGVHQRYVVDNTGIAINETDSAVRYEWGHFEAATETPQHFALRHCAIATIVPKRAFSDADVTRVREIVTSRIGPTSPT
jgi:catechol 2,3-dioxygenase-like lactoylglutathione lyase family enzyme